MANYEEIKNPVEIKKHQKIFEQILQQEDTLNKLENIRVTYSGGSKRCDIYWSDKYKFWSTSFKFTGDEKRKGHRYCNWFGITENKPDKVLELVVEINFSLCGGNTSGKLIKNDGKIFVTHNGNIGRISKKDIFWGNYKGNCFEKGKLALIGELPLDIENLDEKKLKYLEFQKQVTEFIREVKRIKNIPKNVIQKHKKSDIDKK